MAQYYSPEATELIADYGWTLKQINDELGVYRAIVEVGPNDTLYATGRREEQLMEALHARVVREAQAAREVAAAVTADNASDSIEAAPAKSHVPATARQQALILKLMKEGRHLEGGMTDLSRKTYADVVTLDKATASFWITSLLGHY